MSRPPLTRSQVMARVKARDTGPEWLVRRALRAAGVGYKLQRRDLPGRPDITLASRGIVVFVHGCFWHRHPGCPNSRTPKSRVDFWEAKFAENTTRDARVAAALVALGWEVRVIWECEARNPERLAGLAAALKTAPKRAVRVNTTGRS